MLNVLVGDSSAYAVRMSWKKAARAKSLIKLQPPLMIRSVHAFDTVSDVLTACHGRSTHSRDHTFSAFSPIPIITVPFTRFLEMNNVILRRVAVVLGPVVAPTSFRIQLIADSSRYGELSLYSLIGVFATIGVVSAGLDKGDEEKEGEGGLHSGGLIVARA